MSRQKGHLYEDYAAQFLEAKGYRILERNYNTKFGEVDLIAIDDQTLVFVEVKYRSSDTYGKGYEFVTPQKLKRLERTIWHYIKAHACHLPHHYRLDVVSIDGPDYERATVSHYSNVPFNSNNRGR